MPPGLRNAAQTFQRHVDTLFRGMDFVACYIDDLLIMSHSHEEHVQHLRQVLDILDKSNLTINFKKCQIGKEELLYLGYSISAKGFQPPQNKVQAIMEYPKPETIMELRRFIGIINHFCHCIPHAAEIKAPLTVFLKNARKNDRRKINWTPEADRAFEACKQSIVEATCMSFLDPTSPLKLTTDASDIAIGASLEQKVNNEWKPVGFFSRKLSPTEQAYSTYDRELLAIFSSIKFFDHVLEGREFIILTDHKPIIHAFSQRQDKASPRQRRQLDYIAQFCTQIFHLKGEENPVADALSRIEAIDMPTAWDSAILAQAQVQDDELKQIRTNSSLNLIKLDFNDNPVYCDVSTGIVRPYVPAALRRKAFDCTHEPAHPSARVTARSLREKFVWPGIKKDALRWSRECQPCQRAKIHRHNRTPPTNIEVPDQRFNHVHLDLITLPLIDGFRYCLTMMDRFSRWPHAVPLRDMQADTVASAFYTNWICHYGTPLSITTDQGMQFESALFTALARLIGANKLRTTPYHPQSNGLLERWHRTLKTALMCNPHIPWTQLLPTVLLGLRTAYKEDLGASSAELLYGTTLRVPGDFFVTTDAPADPRTLVEKLRSHFRLLKPVPTAHHTKQRYFVFKDLATCTHVFRRACPIKPPLTPPYSGPYRILRRLDEKRYVIEINGEAKTISTSELKPAYIAADEPLVPSRNLQPPKSPDTAGNRPPSRKTVAFSLPSHPAKNAGRGVAVAPRSSLPAAAQSQASECRKPRKQTLVPRIDS